jgi:ABC-type glycerol-3-phosphate transport system substrate-binding protein
MTTKPAIHWFLGVVAAASLGTTLLIGSATASADSDVSHTPADVVVVPSTAVVPSKTESKLVKKFEETAKNISHNLRG